MNRRNNPVHAIIAVLIAIPTLAMLFGSGFFFHRLGLTWDERNTDLLISNLSMVCMFGFIIFCAVAGVALGFGMANKGAKRPRAAVKPKPYDVLPPPHSIEMPPQEAPKGGLILDANYRQLPRR